MSGFIAKSCNCIDYSNVLLEPFKCDQFVRGSPPSRHRYTECQVTLNVVVITFPKVVTLGMLLQYFTFKNTHKYMYQ